MYVDLNRVVHYSISMAVGGLLVVFVSRLTARTMEPQLDAANVISVQSQELLATCLAEHVELLELVNSTLRMTTSPRLRPLIPPSTAR